MRLEEGSSLALISVNGVSKYRQIAPPCEMVLQSSPEYLVTANVTPVVNNTAYASLGMGVLRQFSVSDPNLPRGLP